MTGNQKAEGNRKRSKARTPDYSAWPPRGYVTVPQLMAALGVKCAATIYNYIDSGLLPPLEPIGPNRVGMNVAVAGPAVEQLPAKVRRNRTGTTLTARRVAAREAATA